MHIVVVFRADVRKEPWACSRSIAAATFFSPKDGWRPRGYAVTSSPVRTFSRTDAFNLPRWFAPSRVYEVEMREYSFPPDVLCSWRLNFGEYLEIFEVAWRSNFSLLLNFDKYCKQRLITRRNLKNKVKKSKIYSENKWQIADFYAISNFHERN